jgi:hypothetical protein
MMRIDFNQPFSLRVSPSLGSSYLWGESVMLGWKEGLLHPVS